MQLHSAVDASTGRQVDDISNALSPLRDIVASLAAARSGTPPEGNTRRRLVRRVRAAGVAAIPTLVRAVASPREDEALWACYLLRQLGGPRVAERVSRLLEDPRVSDQAKTLAFALLADLNTRRRCTAITRRSPLSDQRSQGLDLLESGELRPARRLLERVVAADPDDGEALSFLGVCCLELGDAKAALPYLDRAVIVEPDEALHQWNLAAAAKAADQLCRCYLALKRYLKLEDGVEGSALRQCEAGQFVTEYEAAIRRAHPGVGLPEILASEQLFLRALAALTAGRYDQACAGLEQVITALPRHYPSWGNLGAAYFAQGRNAEAMRCFQRALELNPDYEIARENLNRIESPQTE